MKTNVIFQKGGSIVWGCNKIGTWKHMVGRGPYGIECNFTGLAAGAPSQYNSRTEACFALERYIAKHLWAVMIGSQVVAVTPDQYLGQRLVIRQYQRGEKSAALTPLFKLWASNYDHSNIESYSDLPGMVVGLH